MPDRQFKPILRETKPDELPDAYRWIWWLTSTLVILIAILWGVAAILRRQKSILRDSPEFASALSAVEPLLSTRLATPRAIKSWQNRMRFIAERMCPAGRDVDELDRLLHWLGGKIGRQWVPDSWFGPTPKPKPSEPALILLGAIEAVDPRAFRSPPDSVMSNFQMQTMQEASKDSLAPAWRKVTDEFNLQFPNNPSAWPDKDDIRRYMALPETLGHSWEQMESYS